MKHTWRSRLTGIARGTAIGVALGTIAYVASSSNVRTRVSAALQAFRDPALVLPHDPPAVEDPMGPLGISEGFVEAKPLRPFEPVDSDLDDPDSAFLKTLVLPDLRVPITRRTLHYVRMFTKTESGRQSFLLRYRRAGAYREIIERTFREAGLPEDLEWLAAIESGFDPRAVSPAGAAGLWQFMPETGATYGLYQSNYVDERMSIVRATHAAASHLRDLHERFDRWDLALASYNLGYEGVLQAMEKLHQAPGRKPGKSIEFSELAEAKLLPEETSNFVPQITAFAIVAANRSRFGLDMAALSSSPSLDLAEIAVPAGTRLRTIARAAGMSTSSLRDHNPHLLRDRVPPTGGDFVVYIPADRVHRTLASFPVFQEHEVLADEDGDTDVDGPDEKWASPLDGPAPGKPKNRLPVFAVPGSDERVFGPVPLAPLAVAAPFSPKLPVVMVGADLGWRKVASDDAMGVFSASAAPRKGRETIEEVAATALGPRMPEPLVPGERFVLASGVAIEVTRTPGAPLVAITTRIGATNGPSADRIASTQELRQTWNGGVKDLDVGIDLTTRKLRLVLGESDGGATLRRAASAPYRHDLMTQPAGPAWAALAEALFPKGHPLEGTIVTGRSDLSLYCDLLLAEDLRRERSPKHVTVTLVGDVTKSRVQKAFEASWPLPSGGTAAEVGPHPRGDQVNIESATPRIVVGWIGPGEGQTGHASLRVTMEILGAKNSRLRRALIDEAGVATDLRTSFEVVPRASIAAIEITPTAGKSASEVLAKLDAALTALTDEGPTAAEVVVAAANVRLRVEKEQKAAQDKSDKPDGASPALTAMRVKRALDPDGSGRLLTSIGEVVPSTVKAIVKRSLSADHRVVIVAAPATAASTAAALSP